MQQVWIDTTIAIIDGILGAPELQQFATFVAALTLAGEALAIWLRQRGDGPARDEGEGEDTTWATRDTRW